MALLNKAMGGRMLQIHLNRLVGGLFLFNILLQPIAFADTKDASTQDPTNLDPEVYNCLKVCTDNGQDAWDCAYECNDVG